MIYKPRKYIVRISCPEKICCIGLSYFCRYSVTALVSSLSDTIIDFSNFIFCQINHIKDLLNELGPDTENDIEEEGEPEVDGEDSWEEFEEDEDTVDQTAGNGNAMEQA